MSEHEDLPRGFEERELFLCLLRVCVTEFVINSLIELERGLFG